MDLKSQVYLLTKDAQTERQVRSALDADPYFSLSYVCQDVEQLCRRLDRQRAGLVLVDVDPVPLEGVAQLGPLANQYIHSRFLILTGEINAQLVLRAMQAGVRHVQVKDAIRAELPGVLRDLAYHFLGGAAGLGSMLTVFSAGGGCGSTTLAVNTANELQLLLEREVLVVDLDCHYGAVSTYLELSNTYGIAEVLAHHRGIDYHLVRSTAVRHSERLHALLSPAGVNGLANTPLRLDTLDQALRAIRQAYTMSVVDAPRVTLDTATTLAMASSAVWIVLQPTVKDIRMAKALHTGLVSRGIATERIKAIVNRYQKRRQMITFEETQKALEGISLARLSNDYASAIRGINYGQTLAEAAPRSALRRDLLQLLEPLASQVTMQSGADSDEPESLPTQRHLTAG